MSKAPSAAVAAAALKAKPAEDPDATKRLRAKVQDARELQLEIEDLEARLESRKASLKKMFRDELPDLMDKCHQTGMELAADGNMAGFTAKLKAYYYANIAADWPADKRQKAFDWLDRNGHGDIIKTDVVVSFKRDRREETLKLIQAMREIGLESTAKEVVPWNTLTAWLKEQVEVNKEMPPLELFGGDVGRVVEIKPLKKEK